jgi:sugar lactone lactonase YvrE
MAVVGHRSRRGPGRVALRDPNSILYLVDSTRKAEVADKGFLLCNGPTFSPDNRTLYFSITAGRRILSYDVDCDGGISGRRSLFTFSLDDGMPDGLTVDSMGNVWCELYGGGKVVCLNAGGTLTLSLSLPTAFVTSLCFGGSRLKTLYVTTGWSTGTTEATKSNDIGGAVFMRSVDSPGLPEPVFTL